MAVPKRKTGRMKVRSRRSANWKLAKPAASTCSTCGQTKLPHRVCPNCGSYRNREVIDTE